MARMSSGTEYEAGRTETSHQRCVSYVSRLEALPLRFLSARRGREFSVES